MYKWGPIPRWAWGMDAFPIFRSYDENLMLFPLMRSQGVPVVQEIVSNHHRVRGFQWVVLAEAGQARQLEPLTMIMSTRDAMLVIVGKWTNIEVDESQWGHVERIKLRVAMRDSRAITELADSLICLFRAAPELAKARWVMLNAHRRVQERLAKVVSLYGVESIVKVKGGSLSVFEHPDGEGEEDATDVRSPTTPDVISEYVPPPTRQAAAKSELIDVSTVVDTSAGPGSPEKLQQPLVWMVAKQLRIDAPYSKQHCARILESGLSLGNVSDPATPFLMAGFYQREVITNWAPPRLRQREREGDTILRLLETKHTGLPVTLYRALAVLKVQEQRRWSETGVEIPAPAPRSKEGSWMRLSVSGAHYQAIQALRKCGFTIEPHLALPCYWEQDTRDVDTWEAIPDKPARFSNISGDGTAFDRTAKALGIEPPFRRTELEPILEAISPESAHEMRLPPALRRDGDEQLLVRAAGLKKDAMLSAWCPHSDHPHDGAVLNALVVSSGGYPFLLRDLEDLLSRPDETRSNLLRCLSTAFWKSTRCDDMGLWTVSGIAALSAMGFTWEWVYVPERAAPAAKTAS